MADNGALDRIMDTVGGTRRSTRVAKGMASAPTTTPIVRFAAGAAGGSASSTATAVTSTTPLTTPLGDFVIQLRKITQGFSAGLGIPQSLEALLNLAGAPGRRAGTQPTPRTGQGEGTTTIPGMMY